MNRPKNNKIRRPQFLCIVGCEGKNQERIYFDIVQNQDAYADKLRQVFGLAADANIKKEKRVTEIVNQIGLSDIKNAIQRGKKISEDNQGKEANKTPKENRYYDNPDTQMHVLLQFLFAKVGINIDALG